MHKDFNIWFTADTHLGHKRTLELSKRPFKTTEEMDSTIIKNWNEAVNPEDLVFHLGDFGNYEIIKQLNGRVQLLYGNYERKDEAEGLITVDMLYELGFADVVTEDCFDYCFENHIFNAVHEPSKSKSHKFNLFGHIHKLQMVRKNGLNVGVDCHNFTPIDINTVLFYKEAIEKYYDYEVFML